MSVPTAARGTRFLQSSAVHLDSVHCAQAVQPPALAAPPTCTRRSWTQQTRLPISWLPQYAACLPTRPRRAVWPRSALACASAPGPMKPRRSSAGWQTARQAQFALVPSAGAATAAAAGPSFGRCAGSRLRGRPCAVRTTPWCTQQSTLWQRRRSSSPQRCCCSASLWPWQLDLKLPFGPDGIKVQAC